MEKKALKHTIKITWECRDLNPDLPVWSRPLCQVKLHSRQQSKRNRYLIKISPCTSNLQNAYKTRHPDEKTKMKKLLIGLTTGFFLGTGICYMQKPQQQNVRPIPMTQIPCEYTAEMQIKTDYHESTPEKIALTDESLDQYGKQLYKEIYNGECIDLNKFLEAEEQISSIYKEYGFEKAATLYKSLEEELSRFKGETCKFQLYNFDLMAAVASSFSLEDFMKLKDREEDEKFYYQSLASRTAGYLHSQNKDTKEGYIAKLCEGQGNAFINPIEAESSICRMLAYAFPEEVLKSTIAQEVPEIEIGNKYFKSLSEIDDASPLADAEEGLQKALISKIVKDADKENIKKTLISEIANIICERYNSHPDPENGIKGFIELAERNLDLAKANSDASKYVISFEHDLAFEQNLENEVNKQCRAK